MVKIYRNQINLIQVGPGRKYVVELTLNHMTAT